MYLLEYFSFENVSGDVPHDQDSRLQLTVAGMSKHTPLQLPGQRAADSVSQNRQ